MLKFSPLCALSSIEKRLLFTRYCRAFDETVALGVQTAFALKAWRRSVSELARSRRRLVMSDSHAAPESMLFCSGASSIEWDHVHVAKASSWLEKRLLKVRFRPL